MTICLCNCDSTSNLDDPIISELLSKISQSDSTIFIWQVLPEDNLVVAVVGDGILLTQTGQNYIWPREIGGPTIIYPPNTSQGVLIHSDSLGPMSVLIYPETIITEGDRATLSQTYEPTNLADFRSKISSIISDINLIQEAKKEEIQLCKLTGFLVLTLWRAATKNEAQISNAQMFFIKKQYAINLVNLAEWPVEYPFAPPCQICINKKSVAGLQTGLTNNCSDIYYFSG